jgi:hypothetical protein
MQGDGVAMRDGEWRGPEPGREYKGIELIFAMVAGCPPKFLVGF